MEWNRGSGQSQPTGQPTGQSPAQNTKVPRGGVKFIKQMKLAQIGLLFSVTVLVLAVVALLAFSGPKAEKRYVDSNKLQAVFLNGGQVYFGNIKDLNGQYLSMSNIYYLRVNQQVQPNQSNSSSSNDISLVKLGCELHGPQDNMVINREQVIFWENLKDDGQVAKAVANYKQQNPNGQQCQQTGDQSSTTNTNANQNTNNNGAANNSTNNNNGSSSDDEQ